MKPAAVVEPAQAEAAAVPGADACWHLQMLGGLLARSGDWRIERWPSRPVALLLARLALYPQRSHAREELIELIWPGVALDAGRNRLRVALSTLRGLLEPPGAPRILVAERQTLRLHEAAIECDALAFEHAARAGRDARALALYRGELLPGHYDDWVVEERRRLETLHQRLREREALPAQAPASAAAAARAARPDAAAAGRAPAYLSGFIGREAELRALGADLERARLVTLTGPGGCGKTRLAAEFCRSAADFEACVFVALASCADAGRIAERTHAAARLPLGNASPLEHLADRFGAQRLLLVLDNFEQLVDGGGAQVLLEILDRLPLARALVTSRRVLRIAGEQELALRPFALPRADDDAARALRNPAVALFINRARSVRPDFGLNAGNRSDLLRLCRALEGLPLAIEIAASRIRTYTPREMASGIGRRFDLLVRGGGEAARDPRHASLRAAIDWSWRLLDAPQRAFLIALSVFRGGWTADEAGAVAGCSAPHGVLDALVADSLVTVDEQAGAMRFEMLESVREYLVEQADPELRQRLRRAHRACFLARAIDLGEHPGPLPEAALANFVEALASGIEDGEHELAVALALALRPQWESQGLPPQALALLRRLADVAPVATPRLVSLLAMLVRQLVSAAEPGAAAALAERTVELAGTDPAQRAEALLARARATWVCRLDGPACLPQVHEALGLARQAGALDLEAPLCLLLGAITLQHLHDPVAADAIQQRTIECYVRLGRPREAYSAWHARMWCLQRQGRHAQAIALGLAQLREVEALGHGEAQILFLNRLAASHEALRDYAQALDASRREAALAWQRHKIYNLALALWNQCYYLARLRRPEDAARLLAFASRFWVERFDALGVDDLRTVERVRRLVAAQIGAARWPGLWARGQAMGLHEALELGGALG